MDSLENIHVHEKFNTYVVYKEIITVLNLLEKIKYFTLTAFVIKFGIIFDKVWKYLKKYFKIYCI